MSDGPPLLEVDGLSVRRGGEILLDDVALTVARGSITVVVGPNGAGKSTLLAAVLGEIEFRGRIRLHWRGEGRIGFVPQRFAVDKTLPLTAIEFLALARQRRPVCLGIAAATRARAERLLAAAELAGLGGRALGQLSGGELQRLLVEHALDPMPELLLLDEPATGLDAAATARFEERVLHARREAHVSVLMVSHDLAQVRRLADHVVVLDRRVVRRGDASAA
ncbi:MAG TPA: ATP-binding cassette domain-containing protein [Candidatus Binatia bacterium]